MFTKKSNEKISQSSERKTEMGGNHAHAAGNIVCIRISFLHLFLFIVGGLIYFCIETLWRGYSHWTMIGVGGVCFVLCGLLNEVLKWDTVIWKQMFICSIIITAVEFTSGLILNVWLGLGIWDYSNIPLNILGQICLPFTLLWYVLSAPAIILDDYLRYWIFGEEKPHYIWRMQ